MKLWLDDVREAPEGWHWAKTAQEAIDCLRTGKVTECSLDHDLGLDDDAPNMENMNKNGTGYDVICWIESAEHFGWIQHPPAIKIHTQNPVGFARMQQVMLRIAAKRR